MSNNTCNGPTTNCECESVGQVDGQDACTARAAAERVAWMVQMRSGPRASPFWERAFVYDALTQPGLPVRGNASVHSPGGADPSRRNAAPFDICADSRPGQEDAPRSSVLAPQNVARVVTSSPTVRVVSLEARGETGEMDAMPPHPGEPIGVVSGVYAPSRSGNASPISASGAAPTVTAKRGFPRFSPDRVDLDVRLTVEFLGLPPNSWTEQEMETMEWGRLKTTDDRPGGVTWRRTPMREAFFSGPDGKVKPGGKAVKFGAAGSTVVQQQEQVPFVSNDENPSDLLYWESLDGDSMHDDHTAGQLLTTECPLCQYVFVRVCRLWTNVEVSGIPNGGDPGRPVTFLIKSRRTTGHGCLLRPNISSDFDIPGLQLKRRGPGTRWWFSYYWAIPCSGTQRPGVPPPIDPPPPPEARCPEITPDGKFHVSGSEGLFPVELPQGFLAKPQPGFRWKSLPDWMRY